MPRRFCFLSLILSTLCLPAVLIAQVGGSTGETGFERVSDWAPGPDSALHQELCPGQGFPVLTDVYWLEGEADGLSVVVHDGTESTLRRIDRFGTVQTVASFPPAGDLCSSLSTHSAAQTGLFHFFLNDGVPTGDNFHWELWSSDGTPEGTRAVLDLPLSPIVDFGPAFRDDRLFRLRADDSSYRLWSSDGTPEGTQLFLDPQPENLLRLPVRSSGDRVFFATSSSGKSLWISDGTAAGTQSLLNFSSIETISDLMPHEGGVYFFITHLQPPEATTLWFSDGTPEGTNPILQVSADNEIPAHTAIANDLFFFALNEPFPSPDQNLWRSDGTAAGTFPVMEIPFNMREMIAFQDRVLFSARGGGDGVGLELYVSDGTPEGSVLLRDINPGAGGSEPREFLLQDDQVVFTAEDDVYGREIWRTDGTPGGTVLHVDTVPGTDSLEPRQLRLAAGQVFFVGEDAEEGREIYRIDRISSIDVPALDRFGLGLFILLILLAGMRISRVSRHG